MKSCCLIEIGSENEEGGGMMIRGKPCESAWYVSDSIRKVPTVGHLGEITVHFPEMPDGWNFPYAITHVPGTFARLPSYHFTPTSLLFDAHKVSNIQ